MKHAVHNLRDVAFCATLQHCAVPLRYPCAKYDCNKLQAILTIEQYCPRRSIVRLAKNSRDNTKFTFSARLDIESSSVIISCTKAHSRSRRWIGAAARYVECRLEVRLSALSSASIGCSRSTLVPVVASSPFPRLGFHLFHSNCMVALIYIVSTANEALRTCRSIRWRHQCYSMSSL